MGSDSIEMVDFQDVAEKDHRANGCTAARAVSMQISDPESTPTLLTRPTSWGAGLDLLAQHPAVSELILAAVDEDLESTAAFLAAAACRSHCPVSHGSSINLKRRWRDIEPRRDSSVGSKCTRITCHKTSRPS